MDFVCVGEGERSFLELANRLEAEEPADEIPGIWLTKNGTIVDNGASLLPDLHELPPMDIDLYCRVSKIIRKQENREFSLNRGCPFQCTYCNGPSLKALYGTAVVRSKTVDQAIEEIRYVHERYPFKSAAFTSENLFVKRDFALEFLDRYRREIALPFWCQIRVELVDSELAQLLKEAGCHLVSVGIESGSPRVRREILGRLMSNETIIRGCRTLQDHGIRVNAYNMVGIPGETFEEAVQTIYLNAEIRPTSSWCSFFQPYPGSKLTRNLLEDGVITQEVFENVPPSYFAKSVVLGQDAYCWMNLLRLFQLWVMHPKLDKLFRFLCNNRLYRL
ncbi:MAG: B12-binding domain-containing radical SAM protein [Desulfomonilaceae bacterium]